MAQAQRPQRTGNLKSWPNNSVLWVELIRTLALRTVRQRSSPYPAKRSLSVLNTLANAARQHLPHLNPQLLQLCAYVLVWWHASS